MLLMHAVDVLLLLEQKLYLPLIREADAIEAHYRNVREGQAIDHAGRVNEGQWGALSPLPPLPCAHSAC